MSENIKLDKFEIAILREMFAPERGSNRINAAALN